jgi:hypothetical protein
LKKSQKILLSIPSLITFCYALTFFFPVEFAWVYPNWTAYYIQMGIINALTLSVSIFLIVRIWRFKNIDRSRKSGWTFLILFFGNLVALIYIWKKDADFARDNELNSNQSDE